MPILSRLEKTAFQNRIYGLGTEDYPEKLWGIFEEIAELGKEYAIQKIEEHEQMIKANRKSPIIPDDLED
jgi:hypothetical protein